MEHTLQIDFIPDINFRNKLCFCFNNVKDVLLCLSINCNLIPIKQHFWSFPFRNNKHSTKTFHTLDHKNLVKEEVLRLIKILRKKKIAKQGKPLYVDLTYDAASRLNE